MNCHFISLAPLPTNMCACAVAWERTHSVRALLSHSPLFPRIQTLKICHFYFINFQYLPFCVPMSSLTTTVLGFQVTSYHFPAKYSRLFPTSLYPNSLPHLTLWMFMISRKFLNTIHGAPVDTSNTDYPGQHGPTSTCRGGHPQQTLRPSWVPCPGKGGTLPLRLPGIEALEAS